MALNFWCSRAELNCHQRLRKPLFYPLNYRSKPYYCTIQYNQNMTYFIKLVKTSRPLLWFGHFTLLIYGALANGSFRFVSVRFFVLLLLFSLPYSLFIYAINDYYDLKTDFLNARKGGVFGEKHNKKEVGQLLRWGWGGLVCSLLVGSWLGVKVLIVFIILSAVLYSYSARPIRLKSVPVLDMIFGGALYTYLIMVIGYFTFLSNNNIYLIFTSPFVLFALLGLVLQAMGTVLDVVPDSKDNIQTSAIFFGVNIVTTFCLLILGIGMFLARHNILFVFFIGVLMGFCSLAYSKKLRESYVVQSLGGAMLPLIFFIFTIILYFINPAWLRI